jgi:hypothetical protein
MAGVSPRSNKAAAIDPEPSKCPEVRESVSYPVILVSSLTSCVPKASLLLGLLLSAERY